jgi:hypothetical protein
MALTVGVGDIQALGNVLCHSYSGRVQRVLVTMYVLIHSIQIVPIT